MLAALVAAVGGLWVATNAPDDPPAGKPASSPAAKPQAPVAKPAPAPAVKAVAPDAKSAKPAPAKPQPAAEKSAAVITANGPESPLDAALGKAVSLHFDHVPLEDAAASISRGQKIDVVVDQEALAKANISIDAPITIDVKEIPLRSAIARMLFEHKLIYYKDHGQVLITTDVKSAQAFFAASGPSTEKPEISAIDSGASAKPPKKLPRVKPGTQAAAASDVKPAAKSAAASLPPTSGKNPVEPALAKIVSLHFKETPLSEVVDQIAREQQINVLLDVKALNDASIPLDTPVTADFQNLSLASALRRILGERDLSFVLPEGEENVLLITTNDKSKEILTTRVYNLAELDTPDNEFIPRDEKTSNLDEIVELITSTIAPTTWDSAGGAGSISIFGENLVFSQTREVHLQVVDLLSKLKQVRRQQQRKLGGNPVGAFPGATAADEEQFRQKFAARVDMDFKEVALKDVAAWLKKHGLPAVLDEKALAEASLSGDSTVTFSAKQVRLDWGLKELLNTCDANYYLDHEMLLITTDAKSKEHLITVVYPVGDMVFDSHDNLADDSIADFDTLIETITSNVSPVSWDNAGGAGSIASCTMARALVVSQTFEVHRQIEQLLAKVRAEEATRRAAQREKGDVQSPDKPIVRIYQLTAAEAGDPKFPERLATTIKKLIDGGPGGWAGENTFIQVFPTSLLVRQTPAVQVRVLNLLDALQVLQNPPPDTRGRKPQVTGVISGAL